MEKALILTGKIGTNESYQLLVGCNYTSGIYDSTLDRDKFYDELGGIFVERILEKGSSLELGVSNGLRINPETNEKERIQKLDDLLVNQFSQLVCEKLRASSVMTMSACMN